MALPGDVAWALPGAPPQHLSYFVIPPQARSRWQCRYPAVHCQPHEKISINPLSPKELSLKGSGDIIVAV